MSKYSNELKLEVVHAYQRGKGGYQHLANEYGISSKSQVRQWVKDYEYNGEKGLKKSEKKQKYSFDFKLSVVQYYLTEVISYSELARKYKIKNPSLLCRWVQDFHANGLDGLREKPKGRVPKMRKESPLSSETQENNQTTSNSTTQDEYIQELESKVAKMEQELLYAEIQNKFLKEVRKLRLQQEAEKISKPAKLQESSTASEDFIN